LHPACDLLLRTRKRPHGGGPTVSDTIMVVEDDDATREFLADHLAADSYGVVTAATGRQALNLLEVKDCDLVLLDVMLPDASGFELCRRLRAADGIAHRIDPEVPVIMLSGRATETDRVRGFARGADDYIAKPFNYPEVAARIGAVLKRARARRERGMVQVGELRIDPASREVSLGDREIELSAKEFALLHALAGDPTRVFTNVDGGFSQLRTRARSRGRSHPRRVDRATCRVPRWCRGSGATPHPG
jgi:DNA-binding response OmpR family regulator